MSILCHCVCDTKNHIQRLARISGWHRLYRGDIVSIFPQPYDNKLNEQHTFKKSYEDIYGGHYDKYIIIIKMYIFI